MKLTEFGKFTRKLRIENGELLKDMAEKLDVTVSYLSAVEVGKRNIPVKWEKNLIEVYHLNEEESKNLKESIEYSQKIIKINVEQYNKDEKDIVLLLARKLETLDKKEKKELKAILFD